MNECVSKQDSEMQVCVSELFFICFRGWSFLVPAFVMVLVGVIVFLFLVTGELCNYCWAINSCICNRPHSRWTDTTQTSS